VARTDVRPGTVLGRYVVEELLGEGAMGAVFRAVRQQVPR
jgi:hypothetical protein